MPKPLTISSSSVIRNLRLSILFDMESFVDKVPGYSLSRYILRSLRSPADSYLLTRCNSHKSEDQESPHVQVPVFSITHPSFVRSISVPTCHTVSPADRSSWSAEFSSSFPTTITIPRPVLNVFANSACQNGIQSQHFASWVSVGFHDEVFEQRHFEICLLSQNERNGGSD